jgi:hypothetical protein
MAAVHLLCPAEAGVVGERCTEVAEGRRQGFGVVGDITGLLGHSSPLFPHVESFREVHRRGSRVMLVHRNDATRIAVVPMHALILTIDNQDSSAIVR